MEEPCPLANPLHEYQVGLIEAARRKMRSVAGELTMEQLLTIPGGFHNNLLWNMGHVVVATQVLCYKHSGLPLRVPPYAPSFFGKGTRPSDWTAHVDLAEVLLWMEETADFLREDLRQGLFKTYSAYTTSTNIPLTNISEALSYAAWHEALHLGVVLSQRKLV